MKLQKSAVPCGCTLAAAAMCMDINQRKLIDVIGHDGQEIWFPQRSGCAQKRGFHIQEIVDAAFWLGWAVVPFEAQPTIREEPIRPIWPDLNFVASRVQRLLATVDPCMLIGRSLQSPLRHAIAWDGEHYYDPNGGVYERSTISLECLYAFLKI